MWPNCIGCRLVVEGIHAVIRDIYLLNLIIWGVHIYILDCIALRVLAIGILAGDNFAHAKKFGWRVSDKSHHNVLGYLLIKSAPVIRDIVETALQGNVLLTVNYAMLEMRTPQ